MDTKIKIVVSGHCNTGVSTLTYAIKQLLSLHDGIEIDYIPNNIETKSFEDLENQIQPTIEKRLDKIGLNVKENRLKITIEEATLNRHEV